MRQSMRRAMLAFCAVLAASAGADAAALMRLDVALRTDAGNFHATLLHEHLAFDRAHERVHRLTIPLGGDAAAEVRLMTRLAIGRSVEGADVRLQAFAEVTDLMGGAPEILRSCRAARRERFPLSAGTSRVVELAFMPPGGAVTGAPLRIHLLLTRETADEARAFVESLAAAADTPFFGEDARMWRFSLSVRRARGGAETLEEAIELWARPGESAAYHYERARADGGVLERFDATFEPVEEEGSVVLVVEAKGTLRKENGVAVAVDRREAHTAGHGAALALRYGETNEAGMLVEGMVFHLLMERVSVVALTGPAR